MGVGLTLQGKIQLRNGTAAAWTSANPVLLAGEMGVENDTAKFKLGDGVTAWNALGYGGIQGPAVPIDPAPTSGHTTQAVSSDGAFTALAAKAPLASPALTGTPTAPTATAATNNTQLATTAFVQAAVTALINSSPAALDTLQELAAALGNDANFASTVTTALGLKANISDVPELAQDAVGAMLADSNTLDVTYNDAGNAETAEVRIPPQPAVTGASRVYAASENGMYFRRSNGGAAMADTLPTAPVNGFHVKVQNLGTTTAETLTCSAGAGATFGESGATTYVLKYGCRQTFVYDSAANVWRFDAGNGNLLKSPSLAPAAGDLVAYLDSAGVGTIKATAAQVFAAAAQAVKFSGVMIFACANAYSALACDGVTDDTAALAALYAAAPDGSTLVWPGQNSTMVLSSTPTFPSGKHFRLKGGGFGGKTNWLQTSPTADHFAANDWYTSVEDICFTVNGTTTSTNGQALTSGTVLNIAAINTALVAASGSLWLGSSVGWQLLTYSARTSTTVTLSSTGIAASTTVAGIPLVFKTAGAAVNAGNFVGIDMLECQGTNLFNGYVCAGSTANQSTVDGNTFLNTINFDVWIDGANWNGIVNNNTADCTTNSRSVSHCEITQCGSITMTGNQWIRGQYNLRLGSTVVAYPAGVFGVYSNSNFYDNAGIDAVKVQGISAVQRVRFVEDWVSSAAGKGFNLASTASTLPTGITVSHCDIFANGVDGVGGNGAQDLTLFKNNIAGNAANGVNSFVARLYVEENRIGPISGFGANGTGITLPVGAYTTIKLTDNDVTGNTTAFTDNSTSATNKRIQDNFGINPKGAVTTPGVPAAGVAVTNTTGYRVLVMAKMNTTASAAIVINGVASAAGLASQLVPILLDPGSTISFTTTAPLSWTWSGM